ncbi:MAG TPA: carboxypeptidase regulatory-like domain-containing protein [Candidatus Angelobacter sp.]
MSSKLNVIRVAVYAKSCFLAALSGVLLLAVGAGVPAGAQSAAAGQIEVTVLDQNGQALAAVAVSVEQDGKVLSRARTTPSGITTLGQLAPGTYRLTVQQQGFYPTVVQRIEVAAGQTVPVEVRLQVVREYKEEIEVAAEPSLIEHDQAASAVSVNASNISTIPYPSTRDYRNVMAYIPGVVADNGGQVHVAGSSTQQVQDYLDGFEVSQPAGGGLGMRINPDALRKLEVLSSRYSSRFGKGSGGPVDVAVQDGDDKFRINVTDFFPTFQNVKGFQFNNWTPRASFSGPIVKNKAWFDVSHEGENDLNIVKELPDGADTNQIWRIADLLRVRVNLSPGNVLTASALLNHFDSDNAGISPFDPIQDSFNQLSTLYFFSLKDQTTIARNTLLEFGGAFHRNISSLLPMGQSPYVFLPTGRDGNFYLTSRSISERTQSFSNLFLKPLKKAGTHQISLGVSWDRIVFAGQSSRVPIRFVDDQGALLRQITFQNAPHFSLSTQEGSAYALDHWSPFSRLTIDAGGRWDYDSYVSRNLFSPRLAGAALLSRKSDTKLSAGIGVYYDRTNLSAASLALQGSRVDSFFSPQALALPASFLVNPAMLTMPRFVNWSLGLERRLPWRIYTSVNFISRHGDHVWAYELQPGGNYILQDHRNEKYDGVTLIARRELKPGYPFAVSYTRSNARTNETIGFNLDNFTTGSQLGGPLPWNSPDLVQSWGSYPLPWKFKRFDLAYSTLWRTGFPFSTVDEFGRLVEGPAAHRFPNFFTLNTTLETKFGFHGYRWAARIGIDNITNSVNPFFVDNNVNSPFFLNFFGTGHRTLSGRIRFLGKLKK